jgi:hypothetical protein
MQVAVVAVQTQAVVVLVVLAVVGMVAKIPVPLHKMEL